MYFRTLISSLCIAAFAAHALAVDFRTKPISYEVQDLGALSGQESYAVGLNNRGQAVGSGAVMPYGWSHGFINDHAIQDAGAPDGFLQSHLDALNDFGQAVGWANSDFNDVDSNAYLYEGGQWIPLGALPGFDDSRPTDVNNAGQIVGWSYGGGYSRAWLWQDGLLSPLPTPQYTSTARAINQAGDVIAGAVNVADQVGRWHAALWIDGQVVRLGAVTGSRSGSIALDVNDDACAAGYKYTTVYNFTSATAFFWNGDEMILLPKPSGWGNAYANAINESDQIVGDLEGPDDARDGFIWQNGVTRRLTNLLTPDSGWTILGANDVNDAGEIVGVASYQGGPDRAVLLKPTKRPVQIKPGRPTRAPAPFPATPK